MLDSAERVRRAVFGPAPDRPPCGELTIDDGFVRQSLALEGPVSMGHRREVIDILGLDLVVVPLSHGWGAPDRPNLDTALDEIGWWKANTSLFVFGLVGGPFGHALDTWGFEEAMQRLVRLPGDGRGVLAGGALNARGQARLVLHAGADGVILGDDIAHNAGLYVAPRLLRDLGYFGGLASIAAEASSRNPRAPIFFHSDGNIRPVLPDLVAAGFDGLHGLEPAAGLDMARVREDAGQGVCLWGNVDLDWLSRPHSAEEIHSLARRLAVEADPRFILGTTGGLIAGLPVENVVELYRALVDLS
jgi:uroporphyrinogen decarboxylase